uniref:Uncharacterized protein n=1 Tax=Globodera rostochiensis TaxID=31243 RepID=A0A914H653_GLORO
MIDLYFFHSAKMAILFILILSSANLEAQRNENDKFFDLMTTIGEHFGGEFNDAEKALEALVHGKNSDGTLKARQENPQDKIQTFLAVPKCFPESKLSIFDYWIEIIKMKTEESKNPIFGVAIYKEKYDIYKSEYSKERAFKLSRENYKILKQLNDQKFSIYESTNLLRVAFNWGLMKMMSDKGIDPGLHLDSQDKAIRKYVQNDIEESCKKFDNEEAKIIFLNNIHYELAINFEFNQRKDVHDRARDLLSVWFDGCGLSIYGIIPLSGESYVKKNASEMFQSTKATACCWWNAGGKTIHQRGLLNDGLPTGKKGSRK